MKNYGEYSTNFCGQNIYKGRNIKPKFEKKIISPISSALLSDHVYLEDYCTQDLFAK